MSTHRSTNNKGGTGPDLIPPGSGSGAGDAAGRSLALPVTLFFLVLLLAATAAVLFLLPGRSGKTAVTSTKVAIARQELPSVAGQVEPGESGSEQSEKLLQDLLSLQARAGVENVSAWGGEKYQVVLDSAAEGDDYRVENKYRDAAAAYGDAIGELEKLLDSRETIFQTTMEQAYQALEEENSRQALQQFTLALAIDPASSDAKKGAARAASLDRVAAMFKEAEGLRKSGDLHGAETRLVELLVIDGDYQPGSDLLHGVRKDIVEEKFQEAMSNFYLAVEADRLGEAGVALKMLKSLGQVDEEQVRMAAGILAEKEVTARVASLRKKAETLSKKEKWQDALSVYKKILSIAPQALAGVTGQMQASNRLELDTRLNDIINRPRRLQDESRLAAAVELLNYARRVEVKGPVLRSQIDTLNKLITVASTPVSVILKSDNSTDVVIYRVGRMGRFLSREISLRPGAYTVVGTRVGFRDVRWIIEVTADDGNRSFSVRCEEPI